MLRTEFKMTPRMMTSIKLGPLLTIVIPDAPYPYPPFPYPPTLGATMIGDER